MKLLGPAVIAGMLAVVLAACGKKPEMPADAAGVAGSQDAASSPARTEGFRIDPDRLADCANGAVVTVSWDLAKSHPEVRDVDVLAGGKLFAQGGAAGSQATGPWAVPGTEFTLKNRVDGAELGRAVVAGPACG